MSNNKAVWYDSDNGGSCKHCGADEPETLMAHYMQDSETGELIPLTECPHSKKNASNE
jgi:hypothetical protein